MEGGSIPVFSRAELAAHKCKNSLGPLEGTPVLFVDNWEQLPAILTEAASDPVKLAEWHKRFLAWVETFWQQTTERFECVVSTIDAWQTGTNPEPHCAAVAAAVGITSSAILEGVQGVQPAWRVPSGTKPGQPILPAMPPSIPDAGNTQSQLQNSAALKAENELLKDEVKRLHLALAAANAVKATAQSD
eukprot:252865-Rhodomonas_salina.1